MDTNKNSSNENQNLSGLAPEKERQVDASTPFALPLVLNDTDYEHDYVVHDAKWLRVAAFRKTQINGKARAELIVKAVNSYEAFQAMKEALKASAYYAHQIGGYHSPRFVSFEKCTKEVCVKARAALAKGNQQ